MPRSRPFALCLLAGSVLALAAAPARAQDIRSPFRYLDQKQGVSAYAGYLFTSPGLSLTDSTSAEFGPRSAPIVGLRYQIRLSGPVTGELGLAFSPTERRVFQAAVNADSSEIIPIPTGRTAEVPLAMAEAGIRFHITGPRTWNGLAPFVLGTGGLVDDLSGSDPADEDIQEGKRFDFGPSFAFGVGAGTDWFPTSRLSVRAELHGRLWRFTAPEGFTPQGREEIREWKGNGALTIGGVFHF
ncbi:MAG TPA: hypothetical protein VFX98_01610 [Longimicrobiaceae bacterium]|nr:hypothetical protein [Longimicrobiaceae bacterium]